MFQESANYAFFRHVVCTLSAGRGARCGLDRVSIFRGGFIKDYLKPEIFNDKKGLSTKMIFFVITINLNWGELPKKGGLDSLQI